MLNRERCQERRLNRSLLTVNRLLYFDFYVHTRWQIELRQRVYRLRAAVEDVDHTLVCLELELLARLLVDVRRTEHRPALRLRRERNRSRHLCPRLFRRTNDVGGSLIDHCVIEGLETNADSTSHVI